MAEQYVIRDDKGLEPLYEETGKTYEYEEENGT